MPGKYTKGAKNFEEYKFTRKSAAEQLAELSGKKLQDSSLAKRAEPNTTETGFVLIQPDDSSDVSLDFKSDVPESTENAENAEDDIKSALAPKKRGRPKMSEEEKAKRRQLVAKGVGKVGEVDVKEKTKLRPDLVGKTEQEIKAILEAEKEKSQQRAVKNRKSRANGRTFEEEIERGCSFYSESGAALITKVPENRKVVGRTGGRTSMMICVNDKKSQPDFVGTISGGKSIVFEAKHSDKGRIDYGRVTDYQREMLRKHYEFGAECFVLVGFASDIEDDGKKYATAFDFKGETEAVFMIPWNIWENMRTLAGHQWFSLNDCRDGGILAPYRVKYSIEFDEKGNGTGTVYFLDKFIA